MSVGDIIINRAMRTPYRKGHIYGKDGSLYMARYALFETERLSARVHHINREDSDRVLHDHPWNFVSIVLRGYYVELRPLDVEPCFYGRAREDYVSRVRHTGSIAFRSSTDRHRIAHVSDDCWSLFIYGRAVQWWGFYTPAGKIHWRDYLRANGLL